MKRACVLYKRLFLSVLFFVLFCCLATVQVPKSDAKPVARCFDVAARLFVRRLRCGGGTTPTQRLPVADSNS